VNAIAKSNSSKAIHGRDRQLEKHARSPHRALARATVQVRRQ
jgi:hypothetical protein